MDEWFVGRRITLVGIGQLSQCLLSLSLSPSLYAGTFDVCVCECIKSSLKHRI